MYPVFTSDDLSYNNLSHHLTETRMNLQEKKRHVSGEMEFLSLDVAVLFPSPDDLEEDVEHRIDAELALDILENTIPLLDKKVVKMRFGIDEKQASLLEISRKLNISIYNVRKRLTRALKRVRHSLEEDYWRA